MPFHLFTSTSHNVRFVHFVSNVYSRYSYPGDHYVALARGAYEAWHEVEEESGIQLVYKAGGLDIAEKGTEGEVRMKAYQESMDKAGIE